MLSDQIHFDASALLQMGAGFADELNYLHWAENALSPAEIDLGKNDPDSPSPFVGRTNYEAFFLDLPGLSPGGREFAQRGGIKAVYDADLETMVEIQFLSSPRRFFQVLRYNHETSSWEATEEPKRGIEGVERRFAPYLPPSSLFRVLASLPPSTPYEIDQ